MNQKNDYILRCIVALLKICDLTYSRNLTPDAPTLLTRLHPSLIERGMLHAFAAVHEIAVDGVDRAVAALDDRRVVIATLLVLLQMPRPFPGLAFVVGDRNGQAVAAVESCRCRPAANGRWRGARRRARNRDSASRSCGNRAPGEAIVLRRAGSNSLLDAVLAHVGDELAAVAAQHGRLNRPKTQQRLARVPGFAIIVADRHDRNRKRIGVKRQQDSAARQNGRLAPRLPAEPLIQLVLQSSSARSQFPRACRRSTSGLYLFDQFVQAGHSLRR